jgi:hypothetical protein
MTMAHSRSLAFLTVSTLAAGLLGACTMVRPRMRMCTATAECETTRSACVAGRCQRPNPLVNEARRLLFDPIAIAYVRGGGDPARGAMPAVITLGRAADGDTKLLMRFAVPLPKEVKVVEAYIVLERSDAVDTDAVAITLHAERIVDPWDAGSVSFAVGPRLEDMRLPATTVSPEGRSLVRIDVRELVQKWREHDRRDQGVAVVADNTSPTGVAFAVAPTSLPEAPSEAASSADAPRLELYVK